MSRPDGPDPSVRLDSRAAALVFGDRLGLVVGLAAVLGLGLFWRAGLFITDSATIVRTLDAVASGTLQIDVVTGDHFSGPGAVVADGAVYGRNYGQVFLSLPVLWGIEVLSGLAERRIVLVALWHLLAIGLVTQVDRVLERGPSLRRWGTGVVLASFVANLWLATAFVGVSTPLLALQLFGILCAGGVAVGLYRLVSLSHGRRVAWPAGLAGALVLPIGFWAQLPKRHVLGSLVIVWILYAFARSRSRDGAARRYGIERATGFRASMYALVGLLAWVHAAEALFVLVALAAVDVPTAPTNDARSLLIVGVAFGVSLVPFLLTNGLISGDVLDPPRTLPRADAADPGSSAVLGGGTTGGSSLALPGGAAVEKLVWVGSLLLSQLSGSLVRLTSTDAVVSTWIRSGSLAGLADRGVPEYRAVNLAVLEVAPVLAGLVAASAGTLASGPRAVLHRVTAVDAAAVAIAAAYVLLFMQALPIHVQITVRYLLPVYPIGLFLLVRQRPIRDLLTVAGETVGWSYLAVVLVGSQLLLAAAVLSGLSVAEATQLHAVTGLGAAVVLAVAIVVARLRPTARPVAAAALGAAAGLGTAFLLLTGVAYFSFIGRYVLPVAGTVADAIGGI